MVICANCGISALRLLPGDAEVAGWAPEARAVFESVGARSYVELLHVSLVSEPTARPASRHAAASTATTA